MPIFIILCRFAPHRLRIFPGSDPSAPVAARSATSGLAGGHVHRSLSLRSTPLANLPWLRSFGACCSPLGALRPRGRRLSLFFVASPHTACQPSLTQILLRLLQPAWRPQASRAPSVNRFCRCSAHQLRTVPCRFAPHCLRIFPGSDPSAPVAARLAPSSLAGGHVHHPLSLRSTPLANLPWLRSFCACCSPLGALRPRGRSLSIDSIEDP